MEVQETTQSTQEQFAKELGLPFSKAEDTPPETPPSGDPPAPPEQGGDGGVEGVLTPLFEEASKAATPTLSDEDKEWMQLRAFTQKTGIKSFSMFNKVQKLSAEAKTPQDQIDLLITLNEIESNTRLSEADRELLKRSFEEQYGVSEEGKTPDASSLLKRMQLQKEVKGAVARVSELKSAIEGGYQPPQIDDNALRSRIVEIAKTPVGIEVGEFKYEVGKENAAKYYAELYSMARQQGWDFKSDEFANKATTYVKLRANQELVADAIQKAIQYGEEKVRKEVASGRYTPPANPRTPDTQQDGQKTLENFLFGN